MPQKVRTSEEFEPLIADDKMKLIIL